MSGSMLAWAKPGIYQALEQQGVKYAIRIPAHDRPSRGYQYLTKTEMQDEKRRIRVPSGWSPIRNVWSAVWLQAKKFAWRLAWAGADLVTVKGAVGSLGSFGDDALRAYEPRLEGPGR